ncbi:MAG: GNAT family N-acetyltransferase [Bacteroidetes bacterium]|nr:GNAT family N-acetyltransferase [Bacteroidota bacterium]MBS1629908.1 GNAT family N-acetyltransferase [Bacteroidota bacterium]
MMIPKGYSLRTGSEHMQPQRVHEWLSKHSYWAQGIPLATVELMIKHSYCVGVFHLDEQVGFARFVTDFATFAYLADVYVEEAHRGRRLSISMLDALMAAHFVKGLRKLFLATLDAHELYARYGFQQASMPERLMEISKKNGYTSNQS